MGFVTRELHRGRHPRSAARRRHGGLLSFRDAVAMAVGGMIGGGIFSVLGIAVATAGHLAFGAFLIGGVIALLTARSFALLSTRSRRSGGLFVFLRDAGLPRAAGYVSWLLMFGYVGTLAVYGSTFGHYVAHAFGWPVEASGLLSAGLLALFVAVNVRGVGSSALVEDLVVGAKILILALIAGAGLAHFQPARLEPIADHGTLAVLLAATTVFVAFEGFELLPYDYDDMREPDKTLPRAMYLGVALVTLIYIAVTVGAQMLVDDRVLVGSEAVAFAAAGQAAFGVVGYVLAVVGAVLATGSAVNATLFSTSRQVSEIAAAGELPRRLGVRRNGIPVTALVVLAALAGALAMIPDLNALVTFGSAVFLIVFAVANLLVVKVGQRRRDRVLAGAAAFACVSALVVLLVQLAVEDRPTLALIAVATLAVLALRALYVRISRR